MTPPKGSFFLFGPRGVGAAHAMESGAELVSFDGHFDDIDGLAWVQPSGV